LESLKERSLSSPRVQLSPLEDADGEVLFRWVNDRDLRVLSAPYRPVHYQDHLAWWNSLGKRDDLVIFGIRRIDTNGLIGTCQLQHISSIHRTADIQIRIGDAASLGCGFGTEAIRLLVRYAFRDLNLHRVGLQVFADNVRAVRCYEKVGFVREGVQRSSIFVDGRYVDVILMGLLQTEYRGE